MAKYLYRVAYGDTEAEYERYIETGVAHWVTVAANSFTEAEDRAMERTGAEWVGDPVMLEDA